MNSLQDGRVSTADLQYVDIDADLLRKFRLSKGDVLFNRTNSIDLVGETALFDLSGEYVFASYLVRPVTDGRRLMPEVLVHYLSQDAVQQRLKGLATRGVSQSNISATRLRRFAIPQVPLEEQQEIAAQLHATDRKVEAEEMRRAALQALFKTTLHHLMTGKIRVEDL
jgi:type I restriction enzyme S subunit